jgi:hypothetical protein
MKINVKNCHYRKNGLIAIVIVTMIDIESIYLNIEDLSCDFCENFNTSSKEGFSEKLLVSTVQNCA